MEKDTAGVRTSSIPITAIISSKNEERAIASCIRSLRAFDEVVVVDSASADATQAIAQREGARVVNFVWDGRYPKKKQWILDNVELRHDWVFFVDADEYPSEDLIDELRHLAQSDLTDAVAVDVPLAYHFGGKRLYHGHQVVKRCVLDRRHVRFPEVDDLDAPGMGELEGHYQPEASGKVIRAKHLLEHDDPDPLSSWVARHNRYSDWEAHLRSHPEVRAQVRRIRSRQGGLFERLPAKPLAFFLYCYVLRRGWRDGRAGFDYAFALSFYYWLIEAKSRELTRTSRDDGHR